MITRLFRKCVTAAAVLSAPLALMASSHREAPLIAMDPLADNTDVYAFRSPDDPSTVTLIANYIPMQLPQGGPNYYHFSDQVRYEIHVDNDVSTPGDDIVYRFTFTRENEDPSTFFNIRLGAENINTSYTLERSMDGGMTFQTILQDGFTPPYNIGPRSIEGAVGLGQDYQTLWSEAIEATSTGERVFAGPVEDPFFVDFAIFDLGDSPRTAGINNGPPRDGLACFNVHSLAIQVPIATLLKTGAPAQPTSILDPDYVIGVWASASRPRVRTLTAGVPGPTLSNDFVQVSRLGMPLTNEVVIPIGMKDYWNSITPYDELADTSLDSNFYNPELALYMDTAFFAAAVPAFEPLRIQENSLGMFDFTNGADGLFPLKGSPALAGTALDDAAFGGLLLPGPGLPRSVDLWPIFHTGVPNLPPYQLATGKMGNPLAMGKPFVNNFLPNGGDMLRLNMAVPPTPRNSPDFSSEGLVQAAVLGLTDPRFNTNTNVEMIPNMDGFPNGRRLEDDVTRIELQAVSGVVLAAIGLFYDDYDPATSPSPVTQDLLDVLGYSTGVEENQPGFRPSFPYESIPYRGTGPCSGDTVNFVSQFNDLELDVRLINTNFQIFQKIPYMITVTNTGDQPATDIVVDAGLPAGLVFTSATVSQGRYSLFFEEFRVGTLNPGESATLLLTLFSLTDAAPITNFFQVKSASGADFDSDPGNDTDMIPDEDDEDAITINPGVGGGGGADGTADLSLTLTAPNRDYEIYDFVPYTVTIRNDGPDAANNVKVAIGLQPGLVFTSVDESQGDYNLFFEEWRVGTLQPGQTETLTLTLFTLVDDQQIRQFAQVLQVDEGDPDSAPANNNTQTPQEDDEAAVVINIVEDDFNDPRNPSARFSGSFANTDLELAPTLVRPGINPRYTLSIEAEEVEIRLVAANGQVINSRIATPNYGVVKGEVETAGITPGLYLVQFLVDDQPLNAQRIVVQ